MNNPAYMSLLSPRLLKFVRSMIRFISIQKSIKFTLRIRRCVLFHIRVIAVALANSIAFSIGKF